MLNNINKFLPPRQFRIPLIGLLMIVGVVTERSKPVLSNPMAYIPTSTPKAQDYEVPTYTWLQKNSPSDSIEEKEVRLRKALTSVSVPTIVSETTPSSSEAGDRQVQTYTWLQRNSLPSESSTVSVATLPNNLKVPTTTGSAIEPQTSAKNVKVAPRTMLPKQDGIYLYGQSPKPGQIGQGYIIFEMQQGKITGALYMPSSELNCFNGTLESSGELAMTVNGYSGEGSLTQVATNDTLPRVMEDEPTTYAHSITLQDYYPLSSVSAEDRRILQMCKEIKN